MIKRYRVDNDTSELRVQTGLTDYVRGVHAMKMYVTKDDYNGFIKTHMSDEDKKMFGEYTFLPIEIQFNPNDMTIEGTFVPVV